jgi:two-component system response regulator RegX3
MSTVTVTRPSLPAGYEAIAPTTAGHLRVLVIGGVHLDLDGVRTWVDGTQVPLALKEFEVLRELMLNAGRVLTRRQLLDHVWGEGYAETNKTLDVHIKRVRAKIEKDPRHPVHIRTVRGVGYVFDLADDDAPPP